MTAVNGPPQPRRAQPAGPGSSDSWWSGHSGRFVDRGLFFVVGAVIGGVVGFYGTTMGIQKDVHDVEVRVTELETEAKIKWRPMEKKVSGLEENHTRMRIEMAGLRAGIWKEADFRRLEQIRSNGTDR